METHTSKINCQSCWDLKMVLGGSISSLQETTTLKISVIVTRSGFHIKLKKSQGKSICVRQVTLTESSFLTDSKKKEILDSTVLFCLGLLPQSFLFFFIFKNWCVPQGPISYWLKFYLLQSLMTKYDNGIHETSLMTLT